MIKFTIETNKLKNFIAQTLASKQAPISDSSIITFTKDKAIVCCALASDVFVFAEYKKSFFTEYEVDSDSEQVMFTQTLLKNRLAYGFAGEKVTVTIDKEKFTFTGSDLDDKVTETRTAINADKVSPYQYAPLEAGLMPQKVVGQEKKVMKFQYQVLVPVERFTDNLPEQVIVTYNGKDLNLDFSDVMGTRKRLIPIKATHPTSLEDSKIESAVTFNFETLQQLITQFNGDIWLSINQSAVCISQVNVDYSLSYMFAAKITQQ